MDTTTARREAVTYLAITYALATAIAVGLPHANINQLLSVLVPVTSVAILTFTVTPRGRRRALWGSLGLRRAGLSSWAAAVAIPVVLLVLAYGAALALGAARLRPWDVTGPGAADWTINLAINATIGTVVILGEEIGWRGYLLPRVQQLTTRRRAAVVTGFLHGCFHLPLVLIATTYDADGNRWVVAPVVVATITGAGVFYAWLRDRSGSLWPVAIAHNTANTVFYLGAASVVASSPAALAYVAGESGLATLGAVVLLAALILARARVWRRPAAVATSLRPTPVEV